MNCPAQSKRGQERLISYANGLFSGDNAELASHARGCELCSGFLSSQATVWQALDEWLLEEPSSGFEAGLYRRLAASPPQTRWERLTETLRGWVARPAIPIAVMTLVLGVGFCTAHFSPSNNGGNDHGSIPIVRGSEISADQISNALDDLQLLRQLDSAKEEAKKASHAI